MSIKELLLSMGFVELDGWYVNPFMHWEDPKGEAIIQVEELDDLTHRQVLQRITAASFNAGSRWQRSESKEDIVRTLEKLIKDIKKKY